MQEQEPIPPAKTKPLKHLASTGPTDPVVDVSELFRRAGLPCKVLSSPRFADRHHLEATVVERPEHYTLIWAIRSALAGSLPVRRLKTSSGELLLIEYVGFPDGDGQDKNVLVAALLPAPGLVQLVLPEELEDLV